MDLIDGLLADYKRPEEWIGQNGLLKQLTKALVERALQAEVTDHLGMTRTSWWPTKQATPATGVARKRSKATLAHCPLISHATEPGRSSINSSPSTRPAGSGFDDKILSLYARGMTVREIQSHLQEMYVAEVSPTLISSVTDAVLDEVKAWQSRPLDALYPIVYMDCMKEALGLFTPVIDGGNTSAL